jgi:membrane protein DedA with SNARE-associated domain
MAVVKFLAFTVIGCVVWCAALTTVGYELAGSYRHILKGFSYAGYVLAVLAVIAVVGLFFHRLRVLRAEQAERP